MSLFLILYLLITCYHIEKLFQRFQMTKREFRRLIGEKSRLIESGGSKCSARGEGWPRRSSNRRRLLGDRRWGDPVIPRMRSSSEFDHTPSPRKESKRSETADNIIDEIEFATKSTRSRWPEWFPPTGIMSCQNQYEFYKRRFEVLVHGIKILLLSSCSSCALVLTRCAYELQL